VQPEKASLSLSEKIPDKTCFAMLPAIKTAARPSGGPLKSKKDCPDERDHLEEKSLFTWQATGFRPKR